MDELFPLGVGVLLGILFSLRLGVLQPLWRKGLLVVIAGASATLISGEYSENWGFLIVDIGEVALAAWISLACIGRLPRLLPALKRWRH
ncbi:MAG TPA: hypothetical protein VLV76_00940 [Candidatus Acidoferrum sp.]|nr:hypothetical protein [Candidatus Acidoferrum sp.]